ncbi:MAG TPA: putative lipid II flippase FtsW [Polyangia bacterium]|nr:putative lipid II flippase FtsW [Polyangia bacterium]
MTSSRPSKPVASRAAKRATDKVRPRVRQTAASPRIPKPPEPTAGDRALAGAREIWESLRARVAAWLAPEPKPEATMIRPSQVGVDRVLVGAVLMLVAFGTVMVFSSGAVFAAKKYGDSFYFFKRELIYAVLGLGAMSLAMRIDYAVYRRIAYPLLFVAIVCLAAVLKVGSRAGGAIRWFRLGPLSFQPSELGKLALCVYLASLLARKAEKVRVFSVGFLPPLLVTGLMMGLLLKQPDLGTAVIFGCVALGLLFIAGTRSSYLILAVLVAAPAGWKFIVSTPFRMRRMLAFLDPWAFRRDVGYQITESLISVGSGGVTGMGLGDGRQKLFFLPEAHTDFILSIVGEELGLLGVLFVVALFGVLVWRGLRAAMRARDVFGAYLAFGITAMFGLQALVNIGVVLGSLPTKGLPLPFISYGGTSLVMSLFMAGLLANISARNPEPREWLARGRRAGKGANRRLDAGPRLIIEVGPPPKDVPPSAPLTAPAVDAPPSP